MSATWPRPWPWSGRPGRAPTAEPELSEVVDALRGAARREVPQLIEGWLDALDADGRWALLKLLTGGLRVGVSARLAKQAVAELGDVPLAEIEEVWHGQTPPYDDLFAWLEGRGEKPSADAPGRFRPVMLAQAMDEAVDFAKLDPADYAAEWKWDGIRVQAVSEGGAAAALQPHRRRYRQKLSRRAGGAGFRRRDRRRAAGAARRAMSPLRRPAAAAEPQDRRRRAACANSPPASAPTICCWTARRICAACPSPSAASGWRPSSRKLDNPAHRPVAAAALRELGRARAAARRIRPQAMRSKPKG